MSAFGLHALTWIELRRFDNTLCAGGGSPAAANFGDLFGQADGAKGCQAIQTAARTRPPECMPEADLAVDF